GLAQPGQHREPRIREALPLQAAEGGRRLRQALFPELGLGFDDRPDLGEEPWVDAAIFVDFAVRKAEAHRLRKLEYPLGRRRAERRADRVLVVTLAQPFNRDLVEARTAGLQRTQCLLQGFAEGAADRHRLADRLHRSGQYRLGAREFLEGETRDLGDDIID